jgi:Zn-dependent protease with chaperone function
MVAATYLDGRSTQVRPVVISIVGEELVVEGENVNAHIPVTQLVVGEQLGNARRTLYLPDGARCEVSDLRALAQLLTAIGHHDGWVDRLQRRPILAILAVAAVAAMALAAFKWGVPFVATQVARRLPPTVASAISIQTLDVLDGGLLQPSQIGEERQQALRIELRKVQDQANNAFRSALLFRASPGLGANAFTLPDGTIVVLDELVDAVGDDAHVLAVLAHELGHAHERHGLQLLLRSSAVGALLTFYVGDISQWLVVAPTVLVQARYSQEFEREADDYAAALLKKVGLSPALLADDLTELAKLKPESTGGGYLSNHPSTDARIRRLKGLASGQ